MKTTAKKISKYAALLFFFVVALGAGKVQAQENPTFEQTASYIISNTKGRVMYPGDLDAYSRVTGYHLKDVKIEQNGKIELVTDQKFDDNKFSIIFNIFDLVEKVDYPDGIRAYKFLVHFNGLNVSKGYGITFATDADAQKIARAFRHLKKVCTKDSDLFSQVPEEEKKVKLSREETIDYINKMIYFDGKGIARECTYEGNLTKAPGNPGYRYKLYGNKRLSYNSSYKNYSFGAFWQTYTHWNGYSEDLDGTYDHPYNSNSIKFKYFTSISVVENIYGSATNKIKCLQVNFSPTENNVSGGFHLYLPTNSGNCGYGSGASPFNYDKEIKRLTKAFERLKELDSDASEKDPFDD